jgi:hypothetical protein
VPLVPAKPVATGPQADPQAAVRRDYELALQLATRDGWEAFLSQYPDGFYASLAKGQLNKIAAEEARAAAAEKARLAEQEKARLAAEGAKQTEQARAAAAAKVAEEARLAADKAKQIELAKVAAAELARAAAEKVAAEKKAADAAAAELAAKQAAEKQRAGNKSGDDTQKVASLPPPAGAVLSPTELITSVQLELRRVGCLAALANGEWSSTSQRSLTLFNKYAGTKFDVKLASVDALDAIKAKQNRVCPLVCESDYRADGDRCVKTTCRAGYELNDDGNCQKIEAKKPTAKREEPKSKREPSERAKAEVTPTKPQASGQIICNQQGCRPVAKGCRTAGPTYAGSGFAGRDNEVCN